MLEGACSRNYSEGLLQEGVLGKPGLHSECEASETVSKSEKKKVWEGFSLMYMYTISIYSP